MGRVKGSSIIHEDKDPLGLWSTLMLLLGRISEHVAVVEMSELKQPREAVPEEFWENLDEDQTEVFTSRLEALVKALRRPPFPSFEELLKIYCGGSLVQACSFCSSSFSVAAIFGEVESCMHNMPLVIIFPYLPPLFSCGATPCDQQIQIKANDWVKWDVAKCTTRTKLAKNRCDSCFKLASQVHRCTRCYTKVYCSEECWKEDWAVKHKKFCKENALEDRKVKGGSEVRRQAQEKHCEEARLLVSGLAIPGVEPFADEFVKVMETCHKLRSNGKVERTAKKAKAKGGKLCKPVEREGKVQSEEVGASVLEDDLKVKRDSEAQKQQQEEYCGELKSGASKEKALAVVQSSLGIKGKAERTDKKTKVKGGKPPKTDKSEGRVQSGGGDGASVQEVD